MNFEINKKNTSLIIENELDFDKELLISLNNRYENVEMLLTYSEIIDVIEHLTQVIR